MEVTLNDEVCKAIAENKRFIAAALAVEDVNVKCALYGEAFIHGKIAREYILKQLAEQGHNVVAIHDYTDVVMNKGNLQYLFERLPLHEQCEVIDQTGLMNAYEMKEHIQRGTLTKQFFARLKLNEMSCEKLISDACDRDLKARFSMLTREKKGKIGDTLGYPYMGGDPQAWEEVLWRHAKHTNQLDKMYRLVAEHGF